MKKRGFGIKSAIFIIFLIILGAGFWYINNSKEFEKNSPVIEIADKIYWNLRSPMNIKIKDDSGVKFVRISMSDGKSEVNVLNQVIQNPTTELDLNLTFPKTAFFTTQDNYEMSIEATDISKWNFFTGNKASKKTQVILDSSKPDVYVLSQSYSISKGGAAAVVFKATDNQIKDIYIQTNFGKKFKAVPFYKEGYYAALLAWPVQADKFSAEVVARDFAGNESRAHIRYFLENFRYKTSKIALKDSFLDGKIANLTDQYAKDPSALSRLDKMKFINETLRDSNDKMIMDIASNLEQNLLTDFKLSVFYPLKNGKKVADFADHRFYTYENKDVSESWHMGLDLASVARAPIIASNGGRVVFAGENGIYGQNVIIDHGFGLYSLYGHCSKLNVKNGDIISASQQIASTGMTGLALGDHLHFGVLIQGEEVRPQQWMDKKWIADNITSVLNNAKKMIDQK